MSVFDRTLAPAARVFAIVLAGSSLACCSTTIQVGSDGDLQSVTSRGGTVVVSPVDTISGAAAGELVAPEPPLAIPSIEPESAEPANDAAPVASPPELIAPEQPLVVSPDPPRAELREVETPERPEPPPEAVLAVEHTPVAQPEPEPESEPEPEPEPEPSTIAENTAESAMPAVVEVPYGGRKRLQGPAPSGSGLATALKSIEVEQATEAVVVRLRADGELAYSAFVLRQPDRLVIDLPGVRNRIRLADRNHAVGAEPLVRVRSSLFEPPPGVASRVVLDLDRAAEVGIERRGSDLVVALIRRAP
jgi:hypothetical protein